MAASAGPVPIQSGSDSITLFPSTTVATATSANGTATNVSRPINAMALELDVTAAATAAGDTLDVWVQTQLDNANWVDICHFTQLIGTGGAKRYFAKCTAALAEVMFENGTALAAGSIRNFLGDQFRIRYTTAQSSAVSYTFACFARPF